MTLKMQGYLNSLTRKDALDFFRECKNKDEFMAESTEFFTALWDRMVELLKQGSETNNY